MRYLSLFLVAIFFQCYAFAGPEFLQVEGMMLGYYPSLADGVRVQPQAGSREIKFEPGRRCLQNVRTERAGLAYSGISFEAEDRRDVRNKLTGLIGYPGIAKKDLEDEWLRSARGLAADFYRDNLAKEPNENVLQLLFVPMVLSPKPISITRTEWTPEAADILSKQGWAGLESFCGSHFVEALGEENYVIYSIRISFPDGNGRARTETVRLDSHNQSPGLVLNNLFRMRQRFEFVGPDRSVTLDILQVGGSENDVRALRANLGAQNIEMGIERVRESTITRAQTTCLPDNMAPCQRLAQILLDYQFQRLNFHGERPSFTPVRFRIAPLRYLQVLNY